MRLEQTRHAARFCLIEQCTEHCGSVPFVRNHQHVDTTTSGIKHVACALFAHIDICNECGARYTHTQLTDTFKVGTAVDVEIKDHHVNRPTLAGARERSPILTRHEA